jgi:6-phosphogluconolactonase
MKFLYVANRGHNSIAGFAVDTSGWLTAKGHISTEQVPSNFILDPMGRFVFAAGSESGRLASFRINDETGALTRLATYTLGRRPMGMLAIHLGD